MLLYLFCIYFFLSIYHLYHFSLKDGVQRAPHSSNNTTVQNHNGNGYMTNGHGGQNGLENGHSGVIRPMQNGHGGHGVDGHGTLRGHHENNGTLKSSGGTILKKTSQGKR